MRAGKVKCGAYMTEKAVKEGKAKTVIAAENIGESNRRRIESLCREFKVPLVYHSDTEQLSRSVGKKDVPVICVCDDNFAKAINVKGKDGLPNE